MLSYQRHARPALLVALTVGMMGLVGCQSLKTPKTLNPNPHQNAHTKSPETSDQVTDNTPSTATESLAFSISGKIGITTVSTTGKQANSAFYAWSQAGERFAIDLTGALGIGATNIRYNGQTATLISEQTGELSAENPEALLAKATGWQAPISVLPYWILGKTPKDSQATYDDTGKLTQASHGDWTAKFDYKTTALPERLRIDHTDGHRVVMTIAHQE